MRAVFGLTDLDAGESSGTVPLSARRSGGAVSGTCQRSEDCTRPCSVGEQLEV